MASGTINKSNIRVSTLYNANFTTATANVWEKVAQIEIPAPCICQAYATYTSSTPTGIAICQNDGMTWAIETTEQAVGDNNHALRVTTLIREAGTYYLYARYNAANKTNTVAAYIAI